MNSILLIDGQNFLEKIKSVLKEGGHTQPKWHEFNFKKLFDKILEGIDVEERVFYFGRLKEHPDTKKKSKQLIEERRLLKTSLEGQGFSVILAGVVRGHYTKNSNGKKILVFREKGVDVKIAVDMTSGACDDKFNIFLLASSDSDLQPAIKTVKERGKKTFYVGFEINPNKGIVSTTDRSILIREKEILASCPQSLLK